MKSSSVPAELSGGERNCAHMSGGVFVEGVAFVQALDLALGAKMVEGVDEALFADFESGSQGVGV